MKNKILLVLASICISLGLTACGTQMKSNLTSSEVATYYFYKYKETGDIQWLRDAGDEINAVKAREKLSISDEEIRLYIEKCDYDYNAEAIATSVKTLEPTATPVPTQDPEETKIKDFVTEMNKKSNINGNYNVDFTFTSSSDPNGKYYYYDPSYTSADWKPRIATALPNESNYPDNDKIMEMEKELAFLYTYNVPKGMFYTNDVKPSVYAFNEKSIYTDDQISIVNYDINVMDSGSKSYDIFYVYNDGTSKAGIVQLTNFYVSGCGEVFKIFDCANPIGDQYGLINNMKFNRMEDTCGQDVKYHYLLDNVLRFDPKWKEEYLDYVYNGNFMLNYDINMGHYDEYGEYHVSSNSQNTTGSYSSSGRSYNLPAGYNDADFLNDFFRLLDQTGYYYFFGTDGN